MKFKIFVLSTVYFSTISAYLLNASNKLHPDDDMTLSLASVPSDIRSSIYNYMDVSSLSKLGSISIFFYKDIDDWAAKNHCVPFNIYHRNIIDYPVLIFDNQLKVDLTFSVAYYAGDMCNMGFVPQIHQLEEKIFVPGGVNNITYLRRSFFPAEKLDKIKHVDFADGNNAGISVSDNKYFSWCFNTLIKGAPLFSKLTITGYEGMSNQYIHAKLTNDFLENPAQLLTKSCLAQNDQ